METLVKYGWHLLLAAIVGEMLTPFVFGWFYKGYRHSTMAISSLGNVRSPVRLPFNLWMLTAGILLLLSLPAVYGGYRHVSQPLTVTMVLFVAVFAVGACIFSCLFSVNETKGVVTTASKIHGAGSAVGFLLLLVVPLLLAILCFRMGDKGAGAVSAASFALALVFFALFVMADKARFAGTLIAREGLWQRLNLLFMYLPLGYVAVEHMVGVGAL